MWYWIRVLARLLLVGDDRKSDQELYDEGYGAGRAGKPPLDGQWGSLFWRFGWLWGRNAGLRAEVEEVRGQTVDRICAAITDMREQAAKRRKDDEARFVEIIKDWQERTYAAEGELAALKLRWPFLKKPPLLLTWDGNRTLH